MILSETLPSSLPSTFFPLSLGQERLWLHEKTLAANPVYNIPIAYNLTGLLNIEVLKQSLQEIIQRHSILRTAFTSVEETPMQQCLPTVSLFLPVIDLSHLTPEKQKEKLEQVAVEGARQPFDLSECPLWRFQLLRFNDQEHILLLVIHHIICDHWSLHLLLEELATLYQAYCNKELSPLPPLSKQYGEFGQWQRQWLEGKREENQFLYWQQQLEGEIKPLMLPIDYSQKGILSYQGERQLLTISKSLTESLKKLSEQQQATLFMTLLAAFEILLFQYTQQENMIICTPVAGRHRTESKGLIGYFNNILPLQTCLSGDPSFCQLIARVRQIALGAYKNMDIPFQKIANLPNLVRIPLTRAMFALQHSPQCTYALKDLTITYPSFQNAHNGTANFDLSLFLEEKDGQLTGVLDYKTNLFKATTISQLLTEFPKLLERLTNEPEVKLSALPRLRKLEDYAIAINKKSTYIAPQKEIERKIAAIWQSILKVEKVGLEDNFFDLGGNSLALAQVQAQLESIFERSITIVDLFQYSTVSTLADYFSKQASTQATFTTTSRTNAQRQKQALQQHKKLTKLRARRINNAG